MSKGLKALEEIINYAIGNFTNHESKYQKDLEIIKKELNVLEIIDKYLVDIYVLKTRKTLEEYNEDHRTGYPIETQEEFDLLKEVLL